jgi:hypothetical protein
MRILAVALGVAVIGVLSTLQPRAHAQQSPSRALDRTLVCAMGISGGIRKIELVGQSGTREFADPTMWRVLPRAEIFNPYAGELDQLAMVSAGGPPPSGLLFVPNPARCKATNTRVSLSTSGLTGAPASPTGDEYECRVPTKILVRIRAAFVNPTMLRKIWANQAHSYRITVADGPIRQASLTIRNLAGMAVAKATVSESGRTQLLIGAGCTPG